MPTIEIYTLPGCNYCVSAKNLLNNRQLDYIEYDVMKDQQRFTEMLSRSPQRTFPQIFIDGKSIGGFNELAQLNRTQKI
jgi:GrxC family glutaredoxin